MAFESQLITFLDLDRPFAVPSASRSQVSVNSRVGGSARASGVLGLSFALGRGAGEPGFRGGPSMDFWVVALSLAVCLVLLALDGRRREGAIWRDWEIVLTPKGARTCRQLERSIRDDAELIDVALAHAGECGRRNLGDAPRVLATGSALLGRFAAVMRHLLVSMERYSRMVWAVAGVPALPMRRFRTEALACRAALFNLARPFLVTGGERFRLRSLTLRSGFGLLHEIVARVEHRLRRRGVSAAAASEWETVEAARADVATLTEESLVSLRVLMTALAARTRAQASVLAEESRP